MGKRVGARGLIQIKIDTLKDEIRETEFDLATDIENFTSNIWDEACEIYEDDKDEWKKLMMEWFKTIFWDLYRDLDFEKSDDLTEAIEMMKAKRKELDTKGINLDDWESHE